MAALVLLAAIPFLVAVRTAGPINGPDSFWHLLLGRQLRQGWDFGSHDPLSPLSTQSWTYNQWLPEVAASIAEDVGGLPAVAWLVIAVRLALLATLWIVCRRRASTLPALAAATVGAIGSVLAWDARPQLAGVVLFTVVAAAALGCADDGRPRWWVIPLTWLWACTHGTWVLGIGLTLLMALAGLLDRPHERVRQHAARFAVPLGSALAAALTPVGPRLYGSLIAISQNRDLILEWQPLSPANPMLAITLAGIGFVALSWARGWQQRPSWGRIVLLAFATGCALMYARTVALGAVALVPLLADAFQSLLPRRAGRLRLEAASLAIGTVAGLGIAAATVPTVARDPGDAPTALSAVLAHQRGIVFNEIGVAGWLYWAEPQLTPVFDTRWEVFGRPAALAYRSTLEVDEGWQDRFHATGAQLALLNDGSPLATALINQFGWAVLGNDRGYVLLAPR